jgi:hypothetical protein
VDLAFMSMVVHRLVDVTGAARESMGVLRSGDLVSIE